MRRGFQYFLLPWVFLLSAAFIAVSLAAARAQENSPDGNVLLRKVGERYAAARVFSARFRQEIPLQNIGIVRKASGKVYFGRPLKMRWDYDAPESQLFLADGEYFYFQPSGSPEVIRKKVDEKSLGGKIPLLLLFGKGDLSSMFQVEEAIPRQDGHGTVLRLAPKGEGAPEIRRIDLLVDARESLILEVHLFDRLGGENHLYLSEIRFDPPLPAGLFRFRNPSGIPVVDG